MKQNIKELADEMYERVLDTYLKGRYKSFSEYLDDELVLYNESVAKLIQDEVYFKLNKSIIQHKEMPIINDIRDMLKANALRVHSYLSQLFRKKGSFKNIFNYMVQNDVSLNDEYVTKLRAKLPLYLDNYLKNRVNKKQVLKDIAKIKTTNMRIAFKEVVKLDEIHTTKAVKKTLEIALMEKSRYYATRVAITEGQRLDNFQRATEYLKDKNVEFVKFKMSSLHPQMDICDLHANMNIGYGKGIVPKKMMIMLPLHPHCMCRYVKWYDNIEKSEKVSIEDNLKQYSKSDIISILGSKANMKKFKGGERVNKILNSSRDEKYKIREVSKLL